MRALRKSKNLGIKRLARRMGVCPSAISRWEHGSRFPNRESLLRLAEALEVPVELVVSLLMREVDDNGPDGPEALEEPLGIGASGSHRAPEKGAATADPVA